MSSSLPHAPLAGPRRVFECPVYPGGPDGRSYTTTPEQRDVSGHERRLADASPRHSRVGPPRTALVSVVLTSAFAFPGSKMTDSVTRHDLRRHGSYRLIRIFPGLGR